MSTFKDRLLTDVSGLCRELFHRRLQLVREQQLVSEKAKEDIRRLIDRLQAFSLLSPFPDETALADNPVAALKASLADADHDPEEIQLRLEEWVSTAVPPPAAPPKGNPARTTLPINQRMIDNLDKLRSAIDKTRTRLLLAGDDYDQPAYVAARNEFTLAHSVYGERLRLNQVTSSNAECARAEQILLPGIERAKGSNFPQKIQDAADFMKTNTFPAA